MTTCIYHRLSGLLGADTQNTDRSGSIYRTNKIERLADGRFFMGSGHCHTIGLMKRWAEKKFAETARPDFGVLLSDTDEFGSSCLIVSKDGSEVWLVDDEMQPIEVTDDYVAVGSGAAYALGALDAGATVADALRIAAARDPSTSGPFHVVSVED
jgi:hypothetical protein